METTRRSFLIGAAGLIVAPAIVKASSLMPIRAPRVLYLRRNIIELYGQNLQPVIAVQNGWLYSKDGIEFKPLRDATIRADADGNVIEVSARRFDQIEFC